MPRWISVCVALHLAMALHMLIPPEIPKFAKTPLLDAVSAAIARNPSNGPWRDYLLNVKQMIEFANCREQDRFYSLRLRFPGERRCEHLVSEDLKKVWAKSIRRSLELKTLFSFATGWYSKRRASVDRSQIAKRPKRCRGSLFDSSARLPSYSWIGPKICTRPLCPTPEFGKLAQKN